MKYTLGIRDIMYSPLYHHLFCCRDAVKIKTNEQYIKMCGQIARSSLNLPHKNWDFGITRKRIISS